MNLTLYQRISLYLSSHSDVGSDAGLYRDTRGLIFFIQKILLICFAVKVIIFGGLFSYRKVFALFDVQFDRRKYSAVRFKLHRLLYFTRAVAVSHPAVAITPEQVG